MTSRLISEALSALPAAMNDQRLGGRVQDAARQVFVYGCWLGAELWLDSSFQASSRLSVDERGRIARLRRTEDRQRSLAGHLLARWAVAEHQGIGRWEVGCDEGPKGRPRFVASSGTGLFDVNISHSGALVLCAVTADRAVGVDVERIDRLDVSSLATTVLRQSERCFVGRAVDESDAIRRFYQAWTLKEAVVKAVGCGLEVDPHEVGVEFAPPRVTFGPPALRPLTRWRLAFLRLPDGYVGACCATGEIASLDPVMIPFQGLLEM